MADAKPKNHYEVLGVTRRADQDQVRRAYLDAARRWHPDRFSSKPSSEADQAEQAMRQVTQAWSVLGNAASRAAYDRQLVAAAPPPGTRPGVTTDQGVTRIDPRLLDPSFLAARREAQLDEISARSSLFLRAAPVLAVVGLLVAIFVFTAYARESTAEPGLTSVPGPSLGAGIGPNDCVVVTTGPALIEVPCSSSAERVIGARLSDGVCPLGTERDVLLSNGSIVCLDAIR